MDSRKYNSMWPLPGPVDGFVLSLNKALNFIKREMPSDNRMINWFLEEYPNVTKVGNARSYIKTALIHSGLVIYKDGNLALTQDGLLYISKPNNEVLFQILDKNVIGFSETIRILGEKSMDLNKFHKALVSDLGVTWTHAYGQPYWRVSWLRSMGFVQLNGSNYALTGNGKRLLESIGKLSPKRLEEIEQKSEIIEERLEKTGSVIEGKSNDSIPEFGQEIEQICRRLKEFEHLSTDHKQFEEELGRAFKILGFDSTVLGQPGKTDVLIEAPIGPEKYSAIIDGKTTSSEKVLENQINWDTITDHKEDNKSDFAAIIGPSFAGGDLTRRAQTHKILLIETDTLIEILRIHSGTPLTLLDLKSIFNQDPGLLRLENCKDLHESSDSYSSTDSIISKVLSVLMDLQREPERTTVEYIRAELGRKDYTEEELNEVLELLVSFGVINKETDKSYTLIARPDIVAEKFISLARNVLNGIDS